MKRRDGRAVEGVIGAARFIAASVVRVPKLKQLSRRLSAHSERLKHLVEECGANERLQGVDGARLRGLRNQLRLKFLIPISRAGKRLLKFAPNVERHLRAPDKRSTASDIVAASRAMMKAVKPHWALFVDIGFDQQGLAAMKSATDALDHEAKDWDKSRKAHTVALRALESELRAARGVIDVIDAFLLDPDVDSNVRTQWRVYKRIPKHIGRPPRARRKAPRA